jgi:hypothetical protein
MGGERASPERRSFVEGLLGSSGLGNTGVGIADFTPAGLLFSGNEYQRASNEGDVLGAATAMAGLLPGARGVAREVAPAASRVVRSADEYISLINPKGTRVLAGERPNLGMGDMYGMAPRGARPLTTMNDPELGRVRFVEKGGDVYAIARNPDLNEQDVIGYAMRHGDGTELHVVNEAQGRGIGSELSYLYRKMDPFAPSGGLTEGGEATARKTYERLVREGILGGGR